MPETNYEGKAEVFQSDRGQVVRRSWKDYFARASRPTEDFVNAVLNRKELPLETRQPMHG